MNNYWALKAYFAAIDHSVIQDRLRRAIRRGTEKDIAMLVIEHDRTVNVKELTKFNHAAMRHCTTKTSTH